MINNMRIINSYLVFHWSITSVFGYLIIFFTFIIDCFSFVFLFLWFHRTNHHGVNIVLGVRINVHSDQAIRHKILNGLKTFLSWNKTKPGVIHIYISAAVYITVQELKENEECYKLSYGKRAPAEQGSYKRKWQVLNKANPQGSFHKSSTFF